MGIGGVGFRGENGVVLWFSLGLKVEVSRWGLPGRGRSSNSSGGAWVVESEMESEFGTGDSVRRVEPRRQGGSVGRPASYFPMAAVVMVAGHIGVGCGRSIGQVGSVGHRW